MVIGNGLGDIDEKKGLITIQDEIKFNDIELDASRRARR